MIALRREPQRTCIACRSKRSKHELVRIVRTPGGTVELDRSGMVSGRGAYVCTDETCWHTATKRGMLARQLRIDIPRDVIDQLTVQMMAEHECRTAVAVRSV